MFLDIKFEKPNCISVGDVFITAISRKMFIVKSLVLDLTEIEDGQLQARIYFFVVNKNGVGGENEELSFNDFFEYLVS